MTHGGKRKGAGRPARSPDGPADVPRRLWLTAAEAKAHDAVAGENYNAWAVPILNRAAKRKAARK